MPHNMGLSHMHIGQKSYGTFKAEFYGTERLKYNIVLFQCQSHLIFNLGMSHLKKSHLSRSQSVLTGL